MTATPEPTITINAKTTTSKRMASLLESAAYWAGVAAVGFTVLAAAAGLFTWYFSSKLADKKDAEFKQFKQTSETEIARPNERAAEANRIAEEEKLARVKIEERLAGWGLDSEGKVRVIGAVKPFAATPFDLWVDPKEYRFMEALDEALIAAGWTRIEPKSKDTVVNILLAGKTTVRIGYGVKIVIAPESTEKFKEPAAALTVVLKAEGIPAEAVIAQGESPDAIHIVIGQRE